MTTEKVTCDRFLAGFTGEHVALILENHTKIVGTLTGVHDTGDPDHPDLEVSSTATHMRRVGSETIPVTIADTYRVGFDQIARVKFHFSPDYKDRP